MFEPPYLFRSDDSYALRPRVMNGPDLMPYGRGFTLRLTDSMRTSSIRSVALLRPGAVTHGFDQGQRYVPVGFVAREGPRRLLIQAPANANLAPPGDYMLFVVDSVGTDAPTVPSLARWVRITSATPALVDTGDVTEPRGGSVINLHDAGACTDDPSSPVLRLAWTAPADDDTIAFSGRAASYDLRSTPNASPQPNFGDWTAWSTGVPSTPFATEQVGIYGLSANTWYQFALRTTDDHANVSGLSNVTIVKPSTVACDGGGGGYHDGGGGLTSGEAALATSLEPEVNVVASTATENTLFPGAALDSLTTDALPFPGAPPQIDGERRVYVREGSSRGLALDRARLVTADHAPGTTAAACSDGRFLAGTRAPAAHIEDRAGRDLTAAGTGAAAEPLYADSGEVLSISLPAKSDSSEDVLLIETSDGTPGPGGVDVETSDAAGAWGTAARVHPRLHASAQAVSVAGAVGLRLRFRVACAVRFVGRLAGPSSAVVASAALASAQSRGVAWTDEVRSVDGQRATVAPRDTLSLAYQDVPLPEGVARDWFLVLDGIPMSASVALFTAQRAHDERDPVVAFRLHQNVPNPFSHGTLIAFDLPVGSDVRLEIFDLQGRLVRRFADHREAGRHAIEWDLEDAHGRTVRPGIYAYRLHAGRFEARLKMVVMP